MIDGREVWGDGSLDDVDPSAGETLIDGIQPVAGPVPALGEHTDQVFRWLDDLDRAAS